MKYGGDVLESLKKKKGTAFLSINRPALNNERIQQQKTSFIFTSDT